MFNEANTVEQMILDACQGLGWQFVPGRQLPRQSADASREPTALAAGSSDRPRRPGATSNGERPDASACGSGGVV